MFSLTACNRCNINRINMKAINFYSNIVNDGARCEKVLERKSESLQTVYKKFYSCKNYRRFSTWKKIQSTLGSSTFNLKKRQFHPFTDATIKNSDGCSLCSIKTKMMFSSISNEKRENILTIPNLLCLTRIALTPVIAYYLLYSEHTVALALLGVAGATDMLDGFIARNFSNQSSVFGSMLDPFADKVLMTITTVTLAYVNLLPVYLCALIVGRDIGIVSAVTYLRFKTVPRPLTLSKFFDVNLPTVQMKPTSISKVNTALQLGLVGLCMAAPVFDFVDNYWLHAYWYFVAGTTVMSGLSYVVKGKQTFKIVN